MTLVDGWTWEGVSIGVPAPVHGGRIAVDPVHLGAGWVGFDYAAAFGAPVRVVNDAAMQALGSYERREMLFLSLGTGLGSALVLDGFVQPMELGHMPYRKATFEDYVGEAALERRGRSAGARTSSTWWRRSRQRSSPTMSCSAAAMRRSSASFPTTSASAGTTTRSSAASVSGIRMRPLASPADRHRRVSPARAVSIVERCLPELCPEEVT